jgi:hypothetical protein
MTELENVITVRKTANIFGDTKIDGVVSVTHKIVDKKHILRLTTLQVMVNIRLSSINDLAGECGIISCKPDMVPFSAAAMYSVEFSSNEKMMEFQLKYL